RLVSDWSSDVCSSDLGVYSKTVTRRAFPNNPKTFCFSSRDGGFKTGHRANVGRVPGGSFYENKIRRCLSRCSFDLSRARSAFAGRKEWRGKSEIQSRDLFQDPHGRDREAGVRGAAGGGIQIRSLPERRRRTHSER